jgi:hypothetical protein
VRAFFASEELRWRLVATSGLNEPPERRIMTALWTLDRRRRHGLDFFFFVAYYFDIRARVLRDVSCRSR